MSEPAPRLSRGHRNVFFFAIVGIVLAVVLITVFSDSIFGGVPQAGRPAAIQTLRAGDCFDLRENGLAEDGLVQQQDCTVPHDAEIFGTAPLPLDDGLPGDDTLSKAAKAACAQQLSKSDLSNSPAGTTVEMYYPSFPGRRERTVICTFHARRGKLDHPVRVTA